MITLTIRRFASSTDMLCRKPLTVATVFAVATLSTTPCLALDYQPFDWVPAPPNTNIVMGYYQYGGHGEFNNTITGTAKSSTPKSRQRIIMERRNIVMEVLLSE